MIQKTLSLALFTVALCSTSIMAANGTLLIGSGAQSRAMGGVGTAMFVGTESALKNPAMLMANDGDQASLSNTFIFEKATLTADGGISENYGADVMFVPSVGYLKNINKNMVLAIHGAGVGGGAVDYGSNAHAGFLQFKAEQSFVDTAFAFAYKKDEFFYGASLIINHDLFETSTSAFGAQTYDPSLSLGFQLGMAYKKDELTYAATYKSERSIHNKLASGTGIDYDKEIPAELGIGISYTKEKLSVSFEVKDIFWSKSGLVGHSAAYPTADADDGYAADGFRDQIVFALGTSYKSSDVLIYRVGFNYGENPITDEGLADGAANKLHALSEKHFTGGLSYHFSKVLSFDSAVTYSPKNSAYVASAKAINPSITNTNVTYTKEQTTLTLGVTLKF